MQGCNNQLSVELNTLSSFYHRPIPILVLTMLGDWLKIGARPSSHPGKRGMCVLLSASIELEERWNANFKSRGPRLRCTCAARSLGCLLPTGHAPGHVLLFTMLLCACVR